MLKSLPVDLLNASWTVLEDAPLKNCSSCGAVNGHCAHTDGELDEDALSKEDIPSANAPEDQLSGEKEEVIVNPEYQTKTGFRGRTY